MSFFIRWPVALFFFGMLVFTYVLGFNNLFPGAPYVSWIYFGLQVLGALVFIYLITQSAGARKSTVEFWPASLFFASVFMMMVGGFGLFNLMLPDGNSEGMLRRLVTIIGGLFYPLCALGAGTFALMRIGRTTAH